MPSILRLIITAVFATLILSGCVRYQVEIDFDRQTHGEIIQHVKLLDTLTNLSGDVVDDWVNSIEKRAKQLEGYTKHISPQEFIVTVPINNGAELEKKFNQFFQPKEEFLLSSVDNSINNKGNNIDTSSNSSETPQLSAHLALHQNNWLFAIRNNLQVEVDLRSLFFGKSATNILINPDQLVDIQLKLKTPWGLRKIDSSPQTIGRGDQAILVWHLQPGEINKLNTVFWVPSYVGIGALLITLFALLGSLIKYKLLPSIGIGNNLLFKP
ncbi:MAG: DUF3153 domain-containing protein [Microcoleaceae cyanobacterium]